jgi:hypothetical protein
MFLPSLRDRSEMEIWPWNNFNFQLLVLKTETTKRTVFWDVKLSRLMTLHRHLGETYFFHFQGLKLSQTRIRQAVWLPAKQISSLINFLSGF